MNIIAAVNTIFTKTLWNVNEDFENPLYAANFGFSIEKIIVHTEPNLDRNDHYNSPNASTNADRILEVIV